MAEVPPLQVLREENGYTVTEGTSSPDARPKRWVAQSPAQLGEILLRWAVRGEQAAPFNAQAGAKEPETAKADPPAPPAAQVLGGGDSLRFPMKPGEKP